MHANQAILLVDDNREWLETLSEYLRGKGFVVLTVDNPAEGLTLVGRQQISLVVCDYEMPGMDGLAFVRRLRQRQKDLAILMVSAAEESSLAARALEAGARDFAAKGLPPKHLLKKLQQIMTTLSDGTASPLHLWQRLLPNPEKSARRRLTYRRR